MTEMILGKRERLSWVPETSYGSGGNMATTGVVVGLNATFEPNMSQGWQETLTAGADNRSVQDHNAGPLSLQFTLNFTLSDWKWLRFMLDYTNSDQTTYFNHVLTQGNTVDSFILERAMRNDTADHVLTFTGCVVQEATLNFTKASGEGTEGMINVSLKCLAKTVSQGSSVTSLDAGNLTLAPFQYRMAKVTLNSNEITEVNNGELTLSNGIEEVDSRYCNSTLDRAIGEPIPKIFRVSGRYNINIADKTYFDLWNSAAAVSNCTLQFLRGTNDELNIAFSSFTVTGAVSSTALEGVDNADVVFVSEGLGTTTVEDSATWG